MAPPSQLPQVQRVLQQRRRSKGGNRLNAISGERLTVHTCEVIVHIWLQCAVLVHADYPSLSASASLCSRWCAAVAMHPGRHPQSSTSAVVVQAFCSSQGRHWTSWWCPSSWRQLLTQPSRSSRRVSLKGTAALTGHQQVKLRCRPMLLRNPPCLVFLTAPAWSRTDVWTYGLPAAVLLCLEVASTHAESHEYSDWVH